MGVLEDWPRPRVHLEDNILWPSPWPRPCCPRTHPCYHFCFVSLVICPTYMCNIRHRKHTTDGALGISYKSKTAHYGRWRSRRWCPKSSVLWWRLNIKTETETARVWTDLSFTVYSCRCLITPEIWSRQNVLTSITLDTEHWQTNTAELTTETKKSSPKESYVIYKKYCWSYVIVWNSQLSNWAL